MAIVVPTILASTPADYASRIAAVKQFAPRLHVDVTDGQFAESRTVGLSGIYDIDTVPLDLHLMVTRPQDRFDDIVALEPELAIVHYEADVVHAAFAKQLRAAGVKPGLAVLPETSVQAVVHLLTLFDHVLVFTGELGHNGGTFRRYCLDKISQIRELAPYLEIGVDGGINLETGPLAVQAGANVLNCGSYLHEAADPKAAYDALMDATARNR